MSSRAAQHALSKVEGTAKDFLRYRPSVDPEFKRALTVVLIAGALIFGIGAGTLFVVFKRFEGPRAGGDAHMALIGGLLAFVLLMCAVLFALSYSRW